MCKRAEQLARLQVKQFLEEDQYLAIKLKCTCSKKTSCCILNTVPAVFIIIIIVFVVFFYFVYIYIYFYILKIKASRG